MLQENRFVKSVQFTGWSAKTLQVEMNQTIVFVSTSGASESPDSGECEETRRELVGGHPPPLGHCQGEQHEAAEAEKGGEKKQYENIFSNLMEALKLSFFHP